MVELQELRFIKTVYKMSQNKKWEEKTQTEKVTEIIVIGLIPILIFWGFKTCTDSGNETSNISTDQQYSMPWESPNGQQIKIISRALVKANVTGCGEYYVRSSKQNPEREYLVACTKDGSSYTYYIVFTASESLSGPYDGSDITKP